VGRQEYERVDTGAEGMKELSSLSCADVLFMEQSHAVRQAAQSKPLELLESQIFRVK
jgi:hypothetical protein